MTTQTGRLQRSTPEAQGIPSDAILAFVEAAEEHLDSLHSFMLLRHGQVVAEGWWSPYGPGHPHQLFSLTKSFTSTAVGLAVAEGRLSVDDPVLSFFADRVPAEVGEHLAAMRVRHLLTMTTGHEKEPTFDLFGREDGDWVKGFLAHPVAHPPGTHFLYNSSASHVLSAIVQQVTGMPILDYLQARLFAPLGIDKPAWDTCPRGINTGGWGLSLKTDDIARFGQLYLQKGAWRGQRILPEAWVEEATAGQVSNAPNENPEWEQGYGYQFWRCRHGAYRGDGAFGQFCLVLPDQDAVLAITSGIGDMQAVLNVVWEELLPAFGSTALPKDNTTQERLDQKLANLALLPAQGQAFSPLAARVSEVKYAFEANEHNVEAIAFGFGRERCTVSIWDDRGVHQLVCGSGAWIEGETTLDATAPRKVAASGAWIAEDTYTIKLCLYETPFRPTITCRFTEDGLTYDFKANVAFGPVERPTLVGRKVTPDG